MRIGKQKATVETCYIQSTQDGKPFVRVNFLLHNDQERIGADVWLTTEKAIGMARARLKSIGFDVDARSLADIEEDPTLLAGQTCEVDVQEETWNGKSRLKVVWFGQPKPPMKLDDLTRKLRDAKKHHDDVEEDVPPAVAHIPKAERQALTREAAAEDIPF